MHQSKPYDFMVTYTPQREWIERRGILLWLAFFCIELGAGTFIVSSLLQSIVGMWIGWLICAVLGGGFHLLYLGHPVRVWRILFSSGWRTSWISRGMIFLLLFLSLGLIHMLLAQQGSSPIGLLIAVDVFAFFLITYVGFAMNYVNAIPLWNTPILPVLYAILSLWGGLGVTLIVLGAATTALGNIEEWSRIFLLMFVFVMTAYLISIRYQSPTGKVSIRQIIGGQFAAVFWVVVIGMATVFPLAVVTWSWLSDMSIMPIMLYISITFELAGDLVLRYCILRCGFYAPLIESEIEPSPGLS